MKPFNNYRRPNWRK